jgi:hypothetical protein
MGPFRLSYVFYGIGIIGLLFALVRTYYLLWKLRKERESEPERWRRGKGPGV